MTDRHIFTDPSNLVLRSLKGLVSSHPHLSLIPSLKVVYRSQGSHDPSKVSLICGGGSGHEPGTVGFVGQGLLSASVAGDVFASPSAKQVFGGIRAVPSDKGTILIITNYTGDNLHFGLARLMAQSAGIKNVELVVVGDDVSVPKSRGKLLGRRCLAGITMICKILGAGSENNMSFNDLVTLGRSCSANMASVCSALDHCHVPGRTGEWQIPEGRVEIGLGLHNETGVFNIAKPSGEEMIKTMLDLILKQDDPERSFVKFKDGDELALLVNNQGGVSPLEMGAVLDETLTQLESRGITPLRMYNGVFMGSMNMPGISITLLNLTNVASECSFTSVSHLLELLDAPHMSVSWPATEHVFPIPKSINRTKRQDQFTEVSEEKKMAPEGGEKLPANSQNMQKAMTTASEDVIALEPQLTRWDTIVGDGDCGETCANGAKAVLEAVKEGLASDGDVVNLFRELTDIIDDACGGTLGAIISIFLAGITNALISASESSSKPTVDAKFMGQMALEGLETLKQRTAARVGHRTVMDALIPYVETLASTGDVKKAAGESRKGGEGTTKLQAKLGRATYVGEREDGKPQPPDPGAMAFVAVVEGIAKALA